MLVQKERGEERERERESEREREGRERERDRGGGVWGVYRIDVPLNWFLHEKFATILFQVFVNVFAHVLRGCKVKWNLVPSLSSHVLRGCNFKCNVLPSSWVLF